MNQPSIVKTYTFFAIIENESSMIVDDNGDGVGEYSYETVTLPQDNSERMIIPFLDIDDNGRPVTYDYEHFKDAKEVCERLNKTLHTTFQVVSFTEYTYCFTAIDSVDL